MTRSIPPVKLYSMKFYRYGERAPYAEIRINAPTKFLAKLNIRHCCKAEFFANLAALDYERYTIGVVNK